MQGCLTELTITADSGAQCHQCALISALPAYRREGEGIRISVPTSHWSRADPLDIDSGFQVAHVPKQNTGSGGSNACLSVLGRVII